MGLAWLLVLLFGVWNAGVGVVWGVCTLLGSRPFGVWGLLPEIACLPRVCGGWGFLGVLFENCIVDASIFVVFVLVCLVTSY